MGEATDAPSAAQSSETETSLLEIVNGVLRNWRVVLILPLLFAAAEGGMTVSQNRVFVATASFVPQMAESRGIGDAAALAQQFGVSLGTERTGQSPQFYEGLLQSTTILRRAVESEYRIPSDTDRVWRGTLVEYWRLNERTDPAAIWRRGVNKLRGAVATSVRRETGVIELTVFADKPVLAEQIAGRLLALLNEYNLEARQTRARDEAKFVSGRLVEAQGELRAAEDALEAFLRNNRDFRNSPGLMFQHDRLQRHVLARQEVYTALLRAQEQAQIDGMRDTPVLQIIDSPAGSGQPRSRRVVLRTLIAFLTGLLLAVGFATVREVARRERMTNDPRYREFEVLVRRLWSDILHTSHWWGRRATGIADGKD